MRLPSTSVVAALLGLAGAVAVGGAVVGARRILRERVVILIQFEICDAEGLTGFLLSFGHTPGFVSSRQMDLQNDNVIMDHTITCALY